VEALKTRDISINENFLQEPGIGYKLVLLAPPIKSTNEERISFSV